MPLPEPHPTESQEDFISRCMGDNVSVEEFPDGDQRLAVCNRLWQMRTFDEHSNAEVSKRVEKSLETKLEDHKEKVGKDKRKQTTLRKLKIVYNRGIGAYRTNPSSVRPSVSSPEQWAQARVNSFLYALRNLRYRSGKHDTDLLPDEHPMATKEKAADEHRHYEDGEPIPSELPPKYRKSRKGGETGGQACINCKFYQENHEEGNETHRFYCNKWGAEIRPQYWCAAWQASEEADSLDINPDNPRLEDSQWDRFDFRFAENLKSKHPEIWKAGGNIRGNGAFRNWKAYREGSRTDAVLSWVREREAWSARHFEDGKQFKDKDLSANLSNIAGVVAQIKWGTVGTLGEARMKEVIREVIDKRAASKMNKNFAFNSFGIEQTQVDRDSGTMSGVALISVGAALGHGLFVDQDSIDGIMEILEDERLPAYITHRGALFEDRLTREIGMFDNFRIEGDRLLADFQAFDSFREDDSRKFNRLFEMAEKMPERFGLSIVFTADSVWATPEGDVDTLEKPEDAIFEFPSIRVEEVSSADFVDSPAANERGLFSKIDNVKSIKMTKAQLSEQVDALLSEKAEAATHIEALEASLEGHEDKDEAMNALALEKAALEAEVESLKLQLEEAETKIAEIEEKLGSHEEKMKEDEEEMKEKEEAADALRSDITDRDESIKALGTEVEKLKALIAGSTPVATSDDSESYEPSKSSRSKIIAQYAAEKGITEFSATLRLGKERPELFNN
jgi:hypothetical protein